MAYQEQSSFKIYMADVGLLAAKSLKYYCERYNPRYMVNPYTPVDKIVRSMCLMGSESFEKVVLEELKALKAGQENLEGKIDGLEGKIDTIESKIDNMESKIDAIGNKLDDIESKNANRHLEIESRLNALIEDNKSIHEVLGEHEISIRTLRRRPV
ncbi:MAG: hypothetical protein HPY66_0384 [Firmicutes bacterium]|nr:hypothetical protein [Bacillota bacterium]